MDAFIDVFPVEFVIEKQITHLSQAAMAVHALLQFSLSTALIVLFCFD